MKQSAVEWLMNELEGLDVAISYHYFLEKAEQAKEIEKQQVIDAWKDGAYGGGQFTTTFDNEEQYYNETFKNQLQG